MLTISRQSADIGMQVRLEIAMLFKYDVVSNTPPTSRVLGSYGKLWTEFFPAFMDQARSTWTMKTRKEKTRIYNLPYETEQTRLVRGVFETTKCFLYAFVDYPVLKRRSRARGRYGYLRTWNDQSHQVKSVSDIIM